MKMNIIPGINVKTKKDLVEKIQQVKGVKKLHIDVMDGRFVKQKTIQSPIINSLKNPSKLQIHYMGYQPLKEFKKYNNVSDFIFHAESENNAVNVINHIKSKKVKAGIAFNPETNVKNYANEIMSADIALVMTVHPGISGQRMIKEQLKKIAQIRKINRKIIVGVDGGINKLTVKRARADFAVATSAVFNSSNPKKSLKELQVS